MLPSPPAFCPSAPVTSGNSQAQLGARQLSRVLQVSIRTYVKPQFPECLGPRGQGR
ncbi:hypothetical protein I79_015745 [Cricetulus griseus]|uniref:Uncharacterized protein n=1 Tax=Cricetulus griseus TaxID=10029 RepID=G3HXL8_CRIGR|nr:hypothetical protein I79_015745 [Cricetulus griseus]